MCVCVCLLFLKSGRRDLVTSPAGCLPSLKCREKINMRVHPQEVMEKAWLRMVMCANMSCIGKIVDLKMDRSVLPLTDPLSYFFNILT